MLSLALAFTSAPTSATPSYGSSLMARSIVLRFDATCFDCGRSLSAGTTARWFGKGRVSCCGTDGAAAPRPLPPSAFVPGSPGAAAAAPRPLPPSASLASYGEVSKPLAERAPGALERAAADCGVDAEALACGLTPPLLAKVAAALPAMLLLVRLSSGARFLVPAEHAAHVIRCVEESCVDRVRDVTRSPHQ